MPMSRTDPRNNKGKFLVGQYKKQIFTDNAERRNTYGDPRCYHYFHINIIRRTRYTIDVCGGMTGGGWIVKNDINRIFYDPEKNDHYFIAKLIKGGNIRLYYNDLEKLD